ncbi:MAG: nucleoside triphosphate pyrophosphohydrolase [Parcubacteria group bacterium]
MKKVVRYNKLIRDGIPKIIRAAGWRPTMRILKKKEFLGRVKKKVAEEAKELIQSKDKEETINEIVDIQELLDVLASELKITRPEVKKFQEAKRKKRGSFKKRLFLIKEEK